MILTAARERGNSRSARGGRHEVAVIVRAHGAQELGQLGVCRHQRHVVLEAREAVATCEGTVPQAFHVVGPRHPNAVRLVARVYHVFVGHHLVGTMYNEKHAHAQAA